MLPFCLFHPLSHLQIYFLIRKMHLSFFLLGSVFTFIPLFSLSVAEMEGSLNTTLLNEEYEREKKLAK